MKKTGAELSQIAKKAVKTRRKVLKHRKSQQAGRKAWRETIRPSEYGYINELIKTQKIKKKNVFHHEGIPDLMVITKERKIKFYEIKPKRGSLKRQMLNSRQVETIRELLKHEFIEEVSLVRYEKREGKIVYDPPVKLTRANIKQYSCVR